MSQINYDIALYNSPFFEHLISELFRISRYKRNIYKKIRSEEEYSKKLSFEERTILQDLSKKEDKILLEIMASKNWLNLPEQSVDYFVEKLGDKYDRNSAETKKFHVTSGDAKSSVKTNSKVKVFYDE